MLCSGFQELQIVFTVLITNYSLNFPRINLEILRRRVGIIWKIIQGIKQFLR